MLEFALAWFVFMFLWLWVLEIRRRREALTMLNHALELSTALLDFAKAVEAATPEQGDMMAAAPVRAGFYTLEKTVEAIKT